MHYERGVRGHTQMMAMGYGVDSSLGGVMRCDGDTDDLTGLLAWTQFRDIGAITANHNGELTPGEWRLGNRRIDDSRN